jgi:glutaredoxin
MFHIARKKASYPTTYEFPDCPDCKKLKDAMVNVRYDVSSFRPPDPSKSRSRWPKGYQDEMYNLELRANRTKAEYELHLFNTHNDKTYEGSAATPSHPSA